MDAGCVTSEFLLGETPYGWARNWAQCLLQGMTTWQLLAGALWDLCNGSICLTPSPIHPCLLSSLPLLRAGHVLWVTCVSTVSLTWLQWAAGVWDKVNSLRAGDAYLRQWTGLSWVACGLSRTNPSSHRENSPVTQTSPEPTLLSWGGGPCEKIFPYPWPHGKPGLIALIEPLRPYCSQSSLILLRCVTEIKFAQNLRRLGNWH